ncbi:MAG: hypothetical protein ACOYMG_26390, partial [Candidatus Methylumidiphilus sp.]
PSIPGVTDPAIPDNYGPGGNQPPKPAAVPVAAKPGEKPATPAASAANVATAAAEDSSGFFSGSLIIGLLAGFVGAPFLFRLIEERCKGMTAADALKCALQLLTDLFNAIVRVVSWLMRRLTGKDKLLPKD